MFVPHFPEMLSVENEAYCKYLLDYFKIGLTYDNADLDFFGDSSMPYTANVVAKGPGILSGLEEVTYLLKTMEGIEVHSRFKDGELFDKGDILLSFDIELYGLSFKYERLILNFLSRLCGISTLVESYVDVLDSFVNKVELLSTRKVLLGPLDKKAFVVGGGLSHRLNQGQALMIKKYHKNLYGIDKLFEILSDNDLAAYKFLEFEVHSSSEAEVLLSKLRKTDFGIPVGVMFDNFVADELRGFLLNLSDSDLTRCDFIEASGGIALKNLVDYDMPRLNFVSVGSITKDAQAIDLSFDLERR